jgi:hypothetical protein
MWLEAVTNPKTKDCPAGDPAAAYLVIVSTTAWFVWT